MAHKKHHTPPVPPGNQPQHGPPDATGPLAGEGQQAGGGAPGQEQDEKRRLGDFEGAGEHARQQPTPRNDGA